LSRDHPPDKRPKSDKPAIPPVHDSAFDTTGKNIGLVQRCVIIQKDENGFGLTVSGDNPVFVQLVKEGEWSFDFFIIVNGTLVTHSNHVEVVKLIKSGSYVALTVLGRPPGLPQIPLSEVNLNLGPLEDHGAPAVTSLHSPRMLLWVFQEENNVVHNLKADVLQRMLAKERLELQEMKEEYSRNPTTKLLRDIQEAKKQIPLLQDQLSRTTKVIYHPASPESLCRRDSSSPKSTPRDSLNSCPSPETEDTSDLVRQYSSLKLYNTERSIISGILITLSPSQDSHLQHTAGTPSYRLNSQIIGAEDEYFDSEQEQVNGQCSCFQSIELLKSRPAHLATFLHHVVSQFDPAPVLCYLYADLYKQTNPKETRRIFLDFLTFFIDRGANLRVAVPESISSELERRRPELIPEDLHRQFIQTTQDTVLPEVQRILEDFRQKRSMGLTLADGELAQLDMEQIRDSPAMERERSSAENIVSKIDDILAPLNPFSTTIQYVILSYMKLLGVRSKEQRNLESKRVRINFLPKIKVWRFRGFFFFFVSVTDFDFVFDFTLITYLKHQTFLSENSEGGRLRGSQSSEGSDLVQNPACSSASPCSTIYSPASDTEVLSEDDGGGGGGGVYSDVDPPNWQQLVGREVLAGLTPHEIKRQEVINELFYTERAHVRMLKVLDSVFYQKLSRDNILPPADIKNIFTNLEEIIQLHVSISEQMGAIRKKNDSSVVDQIGDDLLSWFSGGEEEKMRRAVGTFCSNQPFALELIKSRQKKDQRFATFMQEAESNRLCRRLQLKDIIPAEMQRLTKYPLLLENIAKYTDDAKEKDKVRRAADCCRKILNHVNQAVKESENKQVSTSFSVIKLSNLDLTKRKLVHEGPLNWKLNKDKTVELYTLLLEDILVLLQKQDEKLILKCHSKNRAGTVDTQHIFSPVIKLSTVLVRSVATDNRSFFVLSMSDNGAQIYELMAQTVSEQRTWQRQITQRAEAMKAKPHSVIPLPQSRYVSSGVQ
uniref:Rho guanine nucleotide exchange factor 12 n=1 Tax=Astyanax mexicanus TaxID=7994 RepID=A0A3B1J789_ASTMX